jgi:hypothetical protein
MKSKTGHALAVEASFRLNANGPALFLLTRLLVLLSDIYFKCLLPIP